MDDVSEPCSPMACSPAFSPTKLPPIPPPSLSTLPVELFHEIAVRTVDASGGPPRLRNLLMVSKDIHSQLNFDANPSFYATVFDIQFDTAALKRRFHSSRLTARCRAEELKKRWVALKRIKQMARGRNAVWGYPGFPGIYADRNKLGDAWLAFLMLTENDGQNMVQLQWANILDWTRSFIHFDVHTISVRSQATGQLPVVTELRALGLWLYWMTTRFDDIVAEPVPALSKVNRMLRPFTFASWAYPSFFAPWQLSHVPPPTTYVPPSANLATGIPVPQPQAPRNRAQALQQAQPQEPAFYRPNFLPPTIVIPSYLGSPLPLTPPLINHSAALLFFTRMQRFHLGQEAALPEDLELLKSFRDANGPHAPYTPPHSRTRFVLGENSRVWDGDVTRLGEVCRTLKTRAIWTSPQPAESGKPGRAPAPVPTLLPAPASKHSEEPAHGMKRYRYVPGTFAGEWEGRFVIYGLDAHQNVNQGVPGLQALESTVLTQDPQSWRIREYHHPSVLRGKHRDTFDKLPVAQRTVRPPIRPAGAPLHAFLPRGLGVTQVRKGGIEAYSGGKDGMGVFYAEVPPVSKDAEEAEDGHAWDESEPTAEDLNGSDDLEIIIEGESVEPMHALPGRQTMMEPGSKVIGTIRRWDGLITLLATPRLMNHAPPSPSDDSPVPARTQWLYRGYMTANGNWVGRWRDTWNDVTVEGYEGVFIMTRRS